jgi:hypothetical protein
VNDTLAWFGLAGDASERDIRRAYAQRLKQARPDEDPAAFQELHERYQRALDCVRNGWSDASVEEMDEAQFDAYLAQFDTDADAEVVRATPQAREGEEPVDWDAFRAEFLDVAARGDAAAMRAWLSGHPALYDLARKQATGEWLLSALEENQVPMPDDAFDAFASFFDQQGVDAEMGLWRLQRLRRRLDLLWRIAPGREHTLRHLGKNVHGDPDASLARKRIATLSSPLTWRNVLRNGMEPHGAQDMVAFIDGLDGGRRDLPPPFRADQVAFWDAANDRTRVTWPRAVLMAARCAVPAAFFGLYLSWMGHPAWGAWGVAISFGVGAAWLAATYLRGYFVWQAAPEYEEVRAPLVRFAWVPLLVGCGFALDHLSGHPAWLYLFQGSAVVTSAWRYLRRTESTNHVALQILAYVALASLSMPKVAAVVASAVWLVDAWQHRRVLNLRRATS